MDSQSAEQLIQILIYILIPVVIGVFGLILFVVYLHFKDKSPKEEKRINADDKESSISNNQNKQS